MPWTSRAEQLQLMNTEYVSVPEDRLIFNERDEEGNQIPPGGEGEDTINGGDGNDTLDGGEGNDTTGGALGAYREETEDERFQREQEEENSRTPTERF
jgi:hypothetical protein